MSYVETIRYAKTYDAFLVANGVGDDKKPQTYEAVQKFCEKTVIPYLSQFQSVSMPALRRDAEARNLFLTSHSVTKKAESLVFYSLTKKAFQREQIEEGVESVAKESELEAADIEGMLKGLFKVSEAAENMARRRIITKIDPLSPEEAAFRKELNFNLETITTLMQYIVFIGRFEKKYAPLKARMMLPGQSYPPDFATLIGKIDSCQQKLHEHFKGKPLHRPRSASVSDAMTAQTGLQPAFDAVSKLTKMVSALWKLELINRDLPQPVSPRTPSPRRHVPATSPRLSPRYPRDPDDPIPRLTPLKEEEKFFLYAPDFAKFLAENDIRPELLWNQEAFDKFYSSKVYKFLYVLMCKPVLPPKNAQGEDIRRTAKAKEIDEFKAAISAALGTKPKGKEFEAVKASINEFLQLVHGFYVDVHG